jgi:hypothetical protein
MGGVWYAFEDVDTRHMALRRPKIQGGGRMKHVTLESYTNREIEWLSEMIAEKLADMGHEGVEGFLFSVEVEFEGAEDVA